MYPLSLSYIIPFYKGEETIIKALDSIYSIDIPESDFEVIIVDDMSPHPAINILKSYCEQHSNLRIIRHKQNKRQGGAKNTGIHFAKGEYVAFADQDDYIIPHCILKALQFSVINHLDMLSCRYSVCYEDSSVKEFGINSPNNMVVSGKEFCEKHFNTGVSLAPWAYLYRREFLLNVAHPFEEHVVMEDSDWIAWHLIHAEKIGYYKHSIYTWVMNPNSITHSNHYINRADWIKFGYRKIRDAKLYASYSSTFSHIMAQDGYENIKGGFMKLWQVDDYAKFYNHIGVNVMQELQKIEWKQPVKFMIHYPMATCRILFVLGSILKGINNVRHKIIKL